MAKDAAKLAKPHDERIELREPLLDEEYLLLARERSVNRVRLLWAHRRFLGRLGAAGLVLATLIAFVIPKRFTSTARLMPPDQGSGQGAAMLAALGGRVGASLTSMAENVLGVKTNGDLFVGILKSDTVRDDLIQKFDLQKVYHDRYIEDCRDDLTSHTDISADSKSGIISVSVIDHDARRSTAMAQEYVNQLNWVVTHLSTSTAHRERVFLDQRLDEVKSDLESAEMQFSRFASQKGAIDIPTQGKAMLESAAALQGQLIAAESELQGLRQIYTDNNARVRSLEARVQDLHASLEKLSGTGATETSSAAELYPSLRQLPVLGVTYADLLRRTKVEEAVFETLTQEDELAKVEEAKEIPSVKVLDSPRVPRKKSFPPRAVIMLLGTFLTLICGGVWVLGHSAWQKVDPNDPRKALATEMLADIRTNLPWFASNGSANGRSNGWLKSKIRRGPDHSSE